MIGVRMKQLRDQLKRLARQRDTQRRSRSRSDTLSVSLVGYTNAGKSTLFNRLTRAKSYAADQLFATLDTTARRCWISDEETVVASDTVGFIRGLPHQLVEAFKSTLDETVHADLLLHVVDASSSVREDQISEVNAVLEEIKADDVPAILVYNKIDNTALEPEIVRHPDGRSKAVFVSALTGEGSIFCVRRSASSRTSGALTIRTNRARPNPGRKRSHTTLSPWRTTTSRTSSFARRRDSR